jgi:hypothetical protein
LLVVDIVFDVLMTLAEVTTNLAVTTNRDEEAQEFNSLKKKYANFVSLFSLNLS